MRLGFPNTVPLYLHKTLGVNIILVTWSRNFLRQGCPFLWVSACVFLHIMKTELNVIRKRKWPLGGYA